MKKVSESVKLQLFLMGHWRLKVLFPSVMCLLSTWKKKNTTVKKCLRKKKREKINPGKC